MISPNHGKGLLVGLLVLSWAVGSHAGQQAFTARCIGIIDGDTIVIQHSNEKTQKIDLHGIDCPELGQPFGMKAKLYTVGWLLERVVTIQPVTQNRQGLTLAKVFVGDTLFNHTIVAAGYAWQYTEYISSYQIGILEKQAREVRRGLWLQPHPTPPWKWRRLKNRSDVLPDQ